MRRLPRAVALAVALIWLLAAPLAMASNNCTTMSAMCEGPCSVSPGALLLAVTVIILVAVAALLQPATPAPPYPALEVPQLPPRSSLRFA